MLTWTLLVLAACLPGGHLYSIYREEIPNGDNVPHPCKPNFIWHGVGHRISQGGGARNPFGEDFTANGKVWTEALCRKDSDGDGRTNGEELGDPDCTWTKGQPPKTSRNITHPGVCDPWNGGRCVARNTWLDCSLDEEFNCDPIKDPDVRNITLRFPRTKVPAKETTYVCYHFSLPDDQEYHMIATQPYIDNHNVMHHIVMTGCTDSAELVDKPYECLMGSEQCFEMLGLWGLGATGNCLNPQAGILVGKGHYRTVSIQMHWTNPGLVDEWFDSSGMILYLTPKLRKYNAGILTLGQSHLAIPPGKSSWVHEGACTSRCTEKVFAGDIQISSTIHHMHYLGIRQNVTLNRPGSPVQVLADDNPYRYDTPKIHMHDPPILVRAGDELRTACTYQSRSRATTTMYGEGSFEEMCFAFLSFFPVENVYNSNCVQVREVDLCDIYEMCDNRVYNTSDPVTSAQIRKVLTNCDVAGSCRSECPAAIEEVKNSNKCVKNAWTYIVDNIYKYTSDPYLYKFVAAMQSCDMEHSEDRATTVIPHRPDSTRAPSMPKEPAGPSEMFLNLVKNMDARPMLQNIIMNVNYNNYLNGDNGDDDHTKTWH